MTGPLLLLVRQNNMSRSNNTVMICPHQIDEEIGHIFRLYRTANAHWLNAWIIRRFKKLLRSSFRIPNNIVEVTIEISAAQLAR